MEDEPNTDLDCLRHCLSALYFRMIEICGYCQLFLANKPPPLCAYLILKRKSAGTHVGVRQSPREGKEIDHVSPAQSLSTQYQAQLWQAGSTCLSLIFIMKALLGTS